MRKIFALFGTIALDGVTTVNRQLKSIDNSLLNFSKKMNVIGKQSAKVGAQMTKALTLPIVGLGAAVVKFGGDFQKSMTQSLAIMGDDAKLMRKDMEDVARSIARTSTISANDAAEAYYYLASAGKDAAQSMTLLPKVAKFAEAGQFDMALATDLLTDAQSALGLTSKNIAEDMLNLTMVSDVLVKANTLANASVQQFSESLTNRAGAALRSVGKTVQEGVAVLAAYADQGTKGAEAGTQLGIVLRDLQKAAIAQKEEFKAYNVSVFDANGEMRNMADIIGDLETSMQGMSDEQKKATLSTLGFQEKSMASLLTIIGTSEKIRQYEIDLNNAGGTTDRVANDQIQNFNDQMKILKNRLVDAAIGLANDLLPVLKNDLLPIFERLIQRIQSIVKWFNDLPSGIKKVSFAFAGLVAVVGPGLIIFSKLIGIIGGIRNAVVLLNLAFSASPIGVIALAVAGLTTALWGLHEAYKSVNEVQEKNRKLLTDDIANKRLQQQKNILEELIYNYARLAKANEIQLTNDELKQTNEAINKLESSIGEFGYSFEGSFITKLESAKNKLSELKGEAEGSEGVFKAIEIKGKTTEELKREKEEKENANLEIKREALENEIELMESAYKDELYAAEYVDKQLKEMEDKRLEDKKKRFEDEKEAKEKLDKIDADLRERVNKRLENHKKIFKETIVDSVYKAADIFSGYYQNQIIEADNAYKRQKENIEKNVTDEELKKKALENLESNYQKKQQTIQKKQALIDKATALFNIAINTASAITKVLWNPVLVGVVAALGAAQAAIVASRPIPLQEGGYTEGSAAGALGMFGERNTKEIILPLDIGVDKLASALIEKLDTITAGNNKGGMLSNNKTNKSFVLNIGTFIGDDRGIKELTRKIIPFINSENERKGIPVYG